MRPAVIDQCGAEDIRHCRKAAGQQRSCIALGRPLGRLSARLQKFLDRKPDRLSSGPKAPITQWPSLSCWALHKQCCGSIVIEAHLRGPFRLTLIKIKPLRRKCTLSAVMIGSPPANAMIPGTWATPASRHVWRNLLEHLQPFCPKTVFIRCKASDIATRPRQTIDEARANRIADAREHDRHGACRTLQRPDCLTPPCEDHVRRERDQLKRAVRLGRR